MAIENNDEGKVVRVMPPKQIVSAVSFLAFAGALLLLALFAGAVKGYQFIGRDAAGEYTTISVTGDGEATAVPDIAEISFTVSKESKTAVEARKTVDEKVAAILAYLKDSGVKEADIKTASYSLYPNYEWEQKQIMCITYPCPQPPGKQILRGYEVSQSISVKVRDLDKVGDIVGGVADKGATNLSGPNFTIDNEDGVKEEARKEAIDKAKVKAEKLADELGVKLVRITAFNEGNDNPMYAYGRGGAEMKTMATDAAMPAPANIPVGENTYTSSVTITYEVR